MRIRQFMRRALLLVLLPASGWADDVDIYLPEYQAEGLGGQPQVMVIFDTSFSMGQEEPTDSGSRTRIAIARDIVSDLVRQYPGVNFALTAFNDNYISDCTPQGCVEINNGGRVVQGFPASAIQSGDERQQLLSMVAALQNNASTPLCETMSEVYRYFIGEEVQYGLESGGVPPERDQSPSVEQSGRYVSPLRPCENVYVIYMTDGLPQFDTRANEYVKNLLGPGASCDIYEAAFDERIENCLPQLTAFMANHDLADGENGRPQLAGDQRAYTFTLGFNTDQQLLLDAAQPPDGIERGYYTARNSEQLTRAFGDILGDIIDNEIRQENYSAASNVAGTRNLEGVYRSLFLPRSYLPWTGNLKKFAFESDGSSEKDNISERDLWSRGTTEQQAPGAVMQGGAGARLLDKVVSDSGGYLGNRTNFYTDMGPDGLLDLHAIGADDQRWQTLQTLFEALHPRAAQTLAEAPYGRWDIDMRNLGDWLMGFDVTDASETEARAWMMGDILHSRPLAINYGCAGSLDNCGESDQRLRVFVGTNEGVLHAFDDSSGIEQWAFWPQESAAMAVYRMLNADAVYPWPDGDDDTRYIEQSARYGIDGSPVAWLDYREEVNDSGQRRRRLEEAILTFGFRRGGRGYYGLDVTQMDRPQLKWRAMEKHWGQSWSTPVAAQLRIERRRLNETNTVETPVFMFGGGYDIAYDSGLPAASALGASFNVLNARSGEIVSQLTHNELVDSVAADITPVDRDFDGRPDGAFFGDVGGNVWFADLADSDNWTLRRVATLGRHAGSGAADRRFFNRANLVRTYIDRRPVDLLLIGSGNRAAPLVPSTQNAFYILEVSPWLNGTAAPPPLSDDKLTNVVANDARPLLRVPSSEDARGNERFSDEDARGFKGWRLTLPPGDKVFSDASTVGGSTLFTTYTPTSAASMCEVAAGRSTLFGFRLPRFVVNEQGVRVQQAGEVNQTGMGRYIQDTPSLLVRDEGVSVLGNSAIDAVNSVLKDGGSEDGRSCGDYDAEEGRFSSCRISESVWWRQGQQ
ncbi:PilC/PilY family type IV pilus protein [Kushneria aurantia]|uniref:PilC/PilY family type IV pilus protein n=1 Tax=Kushneria aurantia TaxID=504092 RepID=A0ABV6FYQ3_9GAMM|nr:PilC/PilY family type IV pilus protein [Kushneria aurantia]